MNQNKIASRLIAVIMVALFFGLALYLRTVLPYDEIFVGEWVKFRGNDAYFFMRQVDNFVHNFPQPMSFDPYINYPHGQWLGSPNFWVYFLGSITWLFGLGSPTEHIIDVVGVYLPAILGAITIIPIYFIGKELFNRWTGIIAAGLIALMPGEILGRSILGFADRDALEVLLTVFSMLFLIKAIKAAKQKQLSFTEVKRRHWAVFTKPLIYSFFTGVFLGMFLLTWRGAFLLVLTILVYFVVQYIVDHLRQKSTDYLCIVGTTTFFVASAMFLPASQNQVYLITLISALLIPLILSIVSRVMGSKRIRPAYYPLILFGLCLVSVGIFYAVKPSIVKLMIEQLSIFIPSKTGLTIAEMRPILFPDGHFSLVAVWGNFTTGFFISLIAIGILAYFVIKRIEVDKMLLFVWSLVMLAATLLLRRFAVLFAINVSLLTGYFLGLILEFAGLKESPPKPVETTGKEEEEETEPKRTQRGGFHITTDHVAIGLAVILVFFLIFFNISPAITTAKAAPFTLSNGWYQALSWMRQSTPDPFGNPDFYYERYELPYHYPTTAYGVVAWWDYGYHIIRISHRLTVCDPGGGARKVVANFFTAQDEASANQIINKLRSKYIIIDYDTATTMFNGILTYAGSNSEEFHDTYYRSVSGKLLPITLYYPQYYRSLSTRLYYFNGKEVTPESIPVISYEEKVGSDGKAYKKITDWKSFTSYEEAMSYTTSQESGNHMIASTDRFASPVPLEALKAYKLVYSSDKSMGQQVKIFEYAP